jgi:hypothetical protein
LRNRVVGASEATRSKETTVNKQKTCETGRSCGVTRRRSLTILGGVALAAGAGAVWYMGMAPAGAAKAGEITVYKSPYCGCCGGWVKHMRANGFAVTVLDVEDVDPIKARHGVPERLASCHTALVDGYVIEGHVPADVIKRFLAERPDALGLAAPGMPGGSPGMEGAEREPYDVVMFDRQGGTSVYAKR